MNFREENQLPSPFDVIDRNVPGIESRLSQFGRLRLKEQLCLDIPELRNLGQGNIQEPPRSDLANGVSVEIMYKTGSNFPGTRAMHEAADDSSVAIRVPFSDLKLSSVQEAKIKRLLRLESSECILSLKVADFPFVSQNRNRAIELMKSLLAFGRDESVNIEDILSNDAIFTESINPVKTKPSFKFPSHWLTPKTASE